MIVDDAGFICQILARILQALNCEVIAMARSGSEAIERALQYKPDVVFMDIVLPGMTGAQAAVEIREVLPDVAIIAMSTINEGPVRSKALEAGCIAFLEKPFNRVSVSRALMSLRSSTLGEQHG